MPIIIVCWSIVHHGRIFSTVPPPAYVPTPTATMPSTPTKTLISLPCRHLLPLESGIKNGREEEIIHPYICFGFKIAEQVVYISDVSYVPDDVWPIIESTPVAVLDCLRLRGHTSHLGLEGSIETARRIGAQRTYLTGFGHEVTHDEYVMIGEILGGATKPAEEMSATVRKGVGMIGPGRDVWVRPAHDGLRVFMEGRGVVRDESY